MFHTQEKREVVLKAPKICVRFNAWLGDGYYFWYDQKDAKEWGHNSKRRTGYFDIYKSEIICDNVLDTVFKEEHYLFWIEQIEKVGKILTKKHEGSPL